MLPRLRAWYDNASLQKKFALHVVLSTALLFVLMLPAVLYIQRRVVLTVVGESGFRIADIFARSSVQAVLVDDYLVMQHVVNGIASEKKVRFAAGALSDSVFGFYIPRAQKAQQGARANAHVRHASC